MGLLPQEERRPGRAAASAFTLFDWTELTPLFVEALQGRLVLVIHPVCLSMHDSPIVVFFRLPCTASSRSCTPVATRVSFHCPIAAHDDCHHYFCFALPLRIHRSSSIDSTIQ